MSNPAQQNNSPAVGRTLRETGDGPWCWQSKAALRRILHVCDGRPEASLMLSVYLALTWLASDNQAAEFSVPIREIAARAGCSYRSASKVLAILREAQLVEIIPQRIPGSKLQAPSDYRLLLPPGTECPAHGTDRNPAALPRLVEESKESKKESIKEAPWGGIAVSAPGADRESESATSTVIRALASLGGANPDEVTSSGMKAVRLAYTEIRAVKPDVTAEDIRQRAAIFQTRFSWTQLTPAALARQWAQCSPTPRAEPSAPSLYTEV